MLDFTNIEYLKNGDSVQKDAYAELKKLQIFDLLSEFNPILVGTIPIGIYTDESDLDIICESSELNMIYSLLNNHFNKFKLFEIKTKLIRNEESLVCRFNSNFPIEIFVQNIPTSNQYAFRHMIKEYEILNQKGIHFKKEIIRLKKSGLKTEPAFAKLLNLKGDPYDELLNYKI